MPVLDLYRPKPEAAVRRPFYRAPIQAGFPSPAADYLQDRLSLDELCVRHPAATFFARAQGDSMEPEIHDGDLLVIDRSLTAGSGDICICVLDGELCVKQLRQWHERLELCSLNPAYAPISIEAERDFELWGVVTHCLHQVR